MTAPRGPSRWVQISLLGASALTVMAGATISPAMPAMQDHFAGVAEVELLIRLVLTIPGLFIALGAPLAGLLIDRAGRKPLLILATLLYAVAGAAGLVLDDLYPILVSRALLGIAVAGVMTTATTLIGDYFHGAARNRFLGWQASFMASGGVVFLLAGGFLADISWRYPFAIYLSALLLIPGMIFALHEPDRSAASGARVVDLPLPRWRLLGIYSLAFLGMLGFYTVPLQLPFLLQDLGSPDPSRAGMAIAVATASAALVSALFGRIKGWLSHRALVVVTFVGMAMGLEAAAHAVDFPTTMLAMIPMGIGMGTLMPNLSLWLMSFAPVALRGRVMGGLTMAIFIGQFLTPFVVEPLQNWVGLAGSFTWMGYGAAGVAVVCLGIALLERRQNQPETAV